MRQNILAGVSASFLMLFGWIAVAQPADGDSSTLKQAAKEEATKMLKIFMPPDMRLAKNQELAFEIAEKSPHAAMIFSSLYDDRSKTLLPEKGPMMFGFGDIVLDAALAREIIVKHDNRERPEKPAKVSDAKVIAEYEVRRLTDGNGYLNIAMHKADNKGREIEKILPNIRIQLQRIGGDGDDGHWEATGWQTY